MSAQRGRHVALMRGINVGGRNLLPMKRLAAMFEAAGCGRVVTYIQSGNVVFDASPTLAARIPALIAKAVSRECGFESPVITRTAAELGRVVRANPFDPSGAGAGALHVVFLADRPSAATLAALDRRRSPPDEFVARGREIYLRLANGVAKTRLTNAYFDTTLGTTSTVRNWNTTLKLVALAAEEM